MADLPSLREAVERDLDHPHLAGPGGAYRPELEQALRNGRDRVLVVEVDGDIVGRITLVFADDMEVFGLVVHEDFRRRGIATELMDSAEALARERGCARVHFTTGKANLGAQKLYRDRGYEVMGEGLSRGLITSDGEVIHEREPVLKLEKFL